jgi:hypothetical protein
MERLRLGIKKTTEKASTIFLKRGCPGWGAIPGPLDFIYFLIFTTLPLCHSGSPPMGDCFLWAIT